MAAQKKISKTYDRYLVYTPCGEEETFPSLDEARRHAEDEAESQDGTAEVYGCTKIAEAEASQVEWREM